jgi:hypothetical protein
VINALVWVLVIIFAGICRPDALKELLPVLAAGAAFSIIFNGKLGRSCK